MIDATVARRVAILCVVTDAQLPSISPAGAAVRASTCSPPASTCCLVVCSDPPIEPGSLPTGEWLCRRCNPPRLSSDLHVVKPFRMLVEREMRENPASFSLPPHLVSNSHLALGSDDARGLFMSYWREV